MDVQSSWSTKDEQAFRFDLALRLIERFDRRLSLFAPYSLVAFGCSIVLIVGTTGVSLFFLYNIELQYNIISALLAIFYILSFSLETVALVFSVLSMGFFIRDHSHGTYFHPYHHHRYPSSSRQFIKRFSTLSRQELYESALLELHHLRIQGKKRFHALRIAFLLLAVATLFLMVTLLFALA